MPFKKGHKGFIPKEKYKIIAEKVSKTWKEKVENGYVCWRKGVFKKDAKHSAIHNWLVRELGRPNKCEVCGTSEAKRYEWSNIDHKYSRDLKDYKRMCQHCHVQYDKKFNNKYNYEPKYCSLIGCTRKLKAKGLCNTHYEHQRLYGTKN